MAKKVKQLAALLLAVLMLAACGAQPEPDAQSPGENDNQHAGTVTVYAREQYRYGLQQVFSHMSLTDGQLRIFWTGDMDSADVVITDHVPAESWQNYRVIDPQGLELQGIEELMVRSEEGIIALPLFLRLDGFWYDRQLYSAHEQAVPQSLESWQNCPLRQEYPAVCDYDDMEVLFWGVIAPYYLECGGTLQALSTGAFQESVLTQALTKTAQLVEQELLMLTQQAQQSFSATKTCFWLTGVNQLAATYHSKSNLSTWRPASSLPFAANQRALVIARADVIAVRKTADSVLTDRFLELFYKPQTIADLTSYVRMPAACRMNYAPAAAPELAQECYSMLASPALDVYFTNNLWNEAQKQQIHRVLLSLLEGELTPQQASEALSH